MARTAIAVGALVVFGLLSLWVGSEMPESSPGTLRLGRVDVGPASLFSPPNPFREDRQVARIAFTFDKDIRARVRKGGFSEVTTILKLCRCFDEKTADNDGFCGERTGGVIFDANGYINSDNLDILTSKDGPSPFHYYLLVDTQRTDLGKPPFDLFSQPDDLCLQIISGPPWGRAKTDVVRISKKQFLAAKNAAGKAEATGNVMRELGLKPLVEPPPNPDGPLPPNPLANPLKPS